MKISRIIFVSLLFFLVVFSFGCQEAKKGKVFYINSYHQGYGSSDDVMAGIKDVLGDKVDLQIAFMDTKRKNDPESIDKKVAEILDEINVFRPDVIIASDDNAVKYVIEPHLKNGSIPIVFCGVNWDADQYQLPGEHVTGMLEVLPFAETVETVRHSYPKIKKLTVLSENSLSEQKNMEAMQGLFSALGLDVTFRLVEDFEVWKENFKWAMDNADFVYIPTNGAVKNWDVEEAKRFVEANIIKPVITCDDFMMPYAVFGLTKVAREQGEWAAKTTLRIIAGAKPSDISITKNIKVQAWLNKDLAEKAGFVLPEEFIGKCMIIPESLKN